MINEKRLVEQFVELIKIPSISGNERDIGRYLLDKFKQIGADEVIVDEQPLKYIGHLCNFGNVIAKFKGNINCEPFLLCCHMDTVPHDKPINPLIKDGYMVSDGTTILGADDKAGIAVILEALKVIVEGKHKHGPIEVLFTTGEEIDLLGAKYVDRSLLNAKFGLVYDEENPYEVIIQAPGLINFDLIVKGLESHAGMAPDKGINAIKIITDALSKLKFGFVGKETIFNIAYISSDFARNVVPGEVVLKGEIRSHNPKEMDDYLNLVFKTFEDTCKNYKVNVDGKEVQAAFSKTYDLAFPGVRVGSDNKVCDVLRRVAKDKGLEFKFIVGQGGSDSNFLFDYGIKAPIMGTGGYNPHGLNEKLNIEEFKTSAEILVNVLTKWAE